MVRPIVSNLRFCISGSTIIVAFRCTTGNGTILTSVRHCLFLTYWPPECSEWTQTHSLPHPENKRQRSINDCWSCIIRNLGGDRLDTVINNVLAIFIAKRGSETHPTPSWKWASTEHQRLLVLHLQQYEWRLITRIQKHGYGSLYRQICMAYSRHILRDSNNIFCIQSYH